MRPLDGHDLYQHPITCDIPHCHRHASLIDDETGWAACEEHEQRIEAIAHQHAQTLAVHAG